MRSKKVAINGLWGVIYRVIVILLGFIGRTVFIHFLSTEYLGIAGLFGNVLTIFSLSELGFSAAISFHLYRLLDQDDRQSIAGIMNFYKKVYRMVALGILILGLSIVPFLECIIKDTTFSMNYIRLVYVIYIVKTVLSYLFAYNFTIVTADQKGYLLTKIDIVIHIAMSLTNIITLFLFKNYIIYLLCEILVGLFGNIIKSLRVQKEYPYIKEKVKIKPAIKSRIIKDVKNIFASKVSTVIVTSTDNILISALISVQTVGIYSNYSMLIAYIQNILTQFIAASQASLGNMLNSESKEYAYVVLKRLTVVLYFVTSFCSACLFNLLNPFIELWIGKEYLLNMSAVALCILSFYIQIIKTPLWFSISGVGFFAEDRNIAICGAITNLISSIIAAYIWGLSGIFIGTICSQIIQWVMKTCLFIKKYIRQSIKEFMILNVKLLIFTIAMSLGIQVIFRICFINNFIIKFFVCIIVPNLVNLIMFHSTEEYIYFVSTIKKLCNQQNNKRRIKINDKQS